MSVLFHKRDSNGFRCHSRTWPVYQLDPDHSLTMWWAWAYPCVTLCGTNCTEIGTGDTSQPCGIHPASFWKPWWPPETPSTLCQCPAVISWYRAPMPCQTQQVAGLVHKSAHVPVVELPARENSIEEDCYEGNPKHLAQVYALSLARYYYEQRSFTEYYPTMCNAR
jgi:hypothetical protein